MPDGLRASDMRRTVGQGMNDFTENDASSALAVAHSPLAFGSARGEKVAVFEDGARPEFRESRAQHVCFRVETNRKSPQIEVDSVQSLGPGK